VHIEYTRFRAAPIAVVPKAVYGRIGKFSLRREPVSRPEKLLVFPKTPCLDRTAAQAVHKDKVYQRFRSTEQRPQTERSFCFFLCACLWSCRSEITGEEGGFFANVARWWFLVYKRWLLLRGRQCRNFGRREYICLRVFRAPTIRKVILW
jgi:hypothetical protein